jgi:hypothetical protein
MKARARRIFYDKLVYPDGAVLEMAIWHVPSPVPGSRHELKYSLFYGFEGQRLVGYDNERGKGDHRHIGEREERYRFTTPERLVEDFLTDVAVHRGES